MQQIYCVLLFPANDSGWPAVGKSSTTLKPPERRDSGTDGQGKSPPSGSPVTPNTEKVQFLNFSSSVLMLWSSIYISFFIEASSLIEINRLIVFKQKEKQFLCVCVSYIYFML